MLPNELINEAQGVVRSCISEQASFSLRPLQYIVAWNGVLTLAFEGFPSSVVALKERLSSSLDLKPENPGSKWPKTTLGALKDNIQPLTLSQLAILHDICERYKPRGWDLSVHSLVTVSFACRSLERLNAIQSYFLVEYTVQSYHFNQEIILTLRWFVVAEEDPVNDEQRAYVQGVVEEFTKENLSNYVDKVQRLGYREDHYRGDSVGATMVSFWGDDIVPPCVKAFRGAVDQALPGVYSWFNDSSLHVTIRAMDN